MSEEIRQRLPKFLNEPSRYIGMTIDEVAIGIAAFFVCFFIFDAPTIGLALWVLVVYGIKYLKKEEGQHYLKQRLYWYLPSAYKMKKIPPSCQREYIG